MHGASSQNMRPEASRPKTPVESRLAKPDAAGRPTTPATPQAPGAFEAVSSSTAQTPAEEKTEPPSVSEPSPERAATGNGEKATPEDQIEAQPEQQYRPGLGPMMGNKAAVANKFRKIVNAQRAFVPRAGGAGERLAKQKDGDPDNITEVIPARSAARNVNKDDARPMTPEVVPPTPTVDKRMSPPGLNIPQSREGQQGSALQPDIEQASSEQDPQQNGSEPSSADVPRPLAVQKPPKPPEPRLRSVEKPKRKPNPFIDAFSNLGIDPAFALDERALNFEDQLNSFGWERNFLQKKKIDAMQTNMRREAGRIEAGSWAGFSDDKDARVADFEKSLDRAIEAVDEMDGLLTLYSVELSVSHRWTLYYTAVLIIIDTRGRRSVH